MRYAGVYAPVPTPFNREGGVDLARLRAAFTRWVASPLTGFVVLGSTGEAALLDDAESDRVVEASRAAIPNGRPFIVGTGRESTEHTIRASRRAAALGAEAVLVRTPSYFKSCMNPDALIRHYTAVADQSPVPVLLYNFAALTGVDLSPDIVTPLARHENVIGMKESGGDADRMAALAAAAPKGFSLLAGSARTFRAALRAGAVGGILALAVVLPDACVRLFELTTSGMHAEASVLQERLAPLAGLLGSAYGVPGVKTALNLTGFDIGYPRAPLQPLTDQQVATLRDALRAFQEVHA
jgi:4-hydroxy-2-oxoglutarate aldolase